jgi:nucleoside-diphosphate-sugar epimerase
LLLIQNIICFVFSLKTISKFKRYLPWLNRQGVKIIRGDVGDAGAYKDALKSKDALVHIALHRGDSAVEMPLNDTRSSVQLFELAAKAGINSIIYIIPKTAGNTNITIIVHAI